MEFTHLKDLKNDGSNSIIRIRICRMWESFNTKKGGELISLDMILIDIEENLIHPSIWSNLVPKFKNLLHEGSLYEVKNFKVVQSVGNFSPLANDIRIIFQKFTTIKKIEETVVSIPKNGFQFISAGLVHSRVNDDTVLSDVVGCIRVVSDIETVGADWKKRDVEIITDYSIATRVTLWGQLAEDFDATTVKTKAVVGPVILIVTCARVKTFQGVVYFATTSASKIFIDLKIGYVSSLIERFTTVATGIHLIENSNEKKHHDEDMLLERLMINDLLCATWDKDMKVPFVVVGGTITNIVSSLRWFYKGCKACYKQLTTIDDGYYCGNCKAESEFPLVLYKIHIRIKDKTGETTCVLFNKVAEKVLDTSAHKLLNKQPINCLDVPIEVQTLIGKEYVFKLKLTEYNVIHGREDFTVASLWIADDKIEKKYEAENVSKGNQLEKTISKNLEVTYTKHVITSDDETTSPTKKKKKFLTTTTKV